MHAIAQLAFAFFGKGERVDAVWVDAPRGRFDRGRVRPGEHCEKRMQRRKAASAHSYMRPPRQSSNTWHGKVSPTDKYVPQISRR